MATPTKDVALNVSEMDPVSYRYKKDYRTALPQLLAVSVKNLLLLGYGMTLGFQTVLIPAVKNPTGSEVLHLNDNEISWLSSLNLIIVPIGCVLSAVVTTPLGRRRAMQVVNIPFFIAWLIFHFSNTTGHLYGALFLTGLGGGLLEAPVLTYVAEITQPHLRGALTATSSMCVIIGVFTQFLFGLFLYWRTIALVNIIFTVCSVVALFFVPESPHWLVSRKRFDDARKSLQWLRGWTTPDAVEEELKDIQALFKTRKVENEDKSEKIIYTMRLYTNRTFLVPFFLVSYSFFVGHFSGMTTLQTYAVTIFEMLDSPLDKYYATLILGIMQILGAGVCVMLVHYIGKRPLTFFSTAGAGLCCILVACYDYFYIHPFYHLDDMIFMVGGAVSSNGLSYNMSVTNVSITSNITTPAMTVSGSNSYSWVPTVLLILLAFISHTGIRFLPWILIGEVYSAKTRSGAAGLSGVAGYIFNFLTNKMFLKLVGTLSIWGTYGLYGVVCISGCIMFYFILPETEGKKLNDIEDHFSGIKKLSNYVYKSKRISKKGVLKMRELKGTTNAAFEASSTDL